RLLESDAAELLKLIVEEGVALQELRQLGGVEHLVDLADAELRGGGADEREDVRILRLQCVVDGPVHLDQRLELAPRRGERRLEVLLGARRQLREDGLELVLAGGVHEELLPSPEHHTLDLGDVRIRPDEDLSSFEAGERSGAAFALKM